MTRDHAAEIVKLVLGAYPTQRQRMSPEDARAMFAVWTLGLADVEFEIARAAVARIVCSSKWMPALAEVRSEIGDVHHGARRNGGEAWGDVLRAVGRYGHDRSPVFVDPLVAQVVDAIGWRPICMSNETDPSPRARFIELYDQLARQERKQAQISIGARLPQRVNEQISAGDAIKGVLDSAKPSGEDDSE